MKVVGAHPGASVRRSLFPQGSRVTEPKGPLTVVTRWSSGLTYSVIDA